MMLIGKHRGRGGVAGLGGLRQSLQHRIKVSQVCILISLGCGFGWAMLLDALVLVLVLELWVNQIWHHLGFFGLRTLGCFEFICG